MSATEPTGNRHDDEFKSWDAFWDETLRQEAAERGEQPTTTIRGVNVRIPADLPLRFDEQLHRVDHADDEAAFAQLLGDLFGAPVLDAWVAAGMGTRELRTVLAWGISNGRGKQISFREAYERVQAAEGKAAAAETSSTRTSGESGATGR